MNVLLANRQLTAFVRNWAIVENVVLTGGVIINKGNDIPSRKKGICSKIVVNQSVTKSWTRYVSQLEVWLTTPMWRESTASTGGGEQGYGDKLEIDLPDWHRVWPANRKCG